MSLRVTKKKGESELLSPEKLVKRLERLCEIAPAVPLEEVNLDLIVNKVMRGCFEGVSTFEIDRLLAETAAFMNTVGFGYAVLAGRIAVSSMHKATSDSWREVCERMYNYVNPVINEPSPILSDEVYEIIMENIEELEATIDYSRDYDYDFFGLKTLELSYLTKLGKEIVERPQMLLMRVSVGIHKRDIASAIKTYDYMSRLLFTHATPTLFNSGTPRPQMSSCFLVTMDDDSIEGIYSTLATTAKISKSAGGIGVSVHTIRGAQSYIKGTNGTSNGIVPMLRVFNNTARYVDQGGGKRKGAFAMYLEPWHSDIEDFLNLKKNHGNEEQRARDLFYGLWIPDLFMERVEADEDWSLLCPNECKGLADTYGEEFVKLYTDYEKSGKARKTMKARDLWFAIVESQIETGTPYMLYKDACNRKSNQKNLGTIRSSNLCTEIIEYTSPEEVAVCNLASIALSKCVIDGKFDFQLLYDLTYHVTGNLNRVIDNSFYPVPQAEYSNRKNRPMGLGVQGLADTFCMLRYPFDSEEARLLNKQIFETIYFAALTCSMDIAKIDGPYDSYEGSPVSQGQLQFDLWGVTPTDMHDWDSLKAEIAVHGIRNSLLLAPMPTASTSQILGNNECFEPFTSNIYNRRVLAGEFVIVNKYLMKDLLDRGLWSEDLRNQIIADRGSIKRIKEIPQDLKELYRTVWEIPQKSILDMAADRGAYIDQSQSLNIFISDPSFEKITSMHFYGWKKGLKTGMYYLRTRPAVDAIQFTVDQSKLESAATTPNSPNKRKKRSYNTEEITEELLFPQRKILFRTMFNSNDEGCLMCSS